ncbi:unnamed protein product [Chrysoparadoxa australica]
MRRYRELDEMVWALRREGKPLPAILRFPPKQGFVFCRPDTAFLQNRALGIERYLSELSNHDSSWYSATVSELLWPEEARISPARPEQRATRATRPEKPTRDMAATPPMSPERAHGPSVGQPVSPEWQLGSARAKREKERMDALRRPSLYLRMQEYLGTQT